MNMRKALEKNERFIAVSRVTKFPIFIFVENKSRDVLAGDATVSIAYNDYAHLGVLQSKFHTDWFLHQCSTLETRLRYTNKTVFETFPFPEKITSEVDAAMKNIELYRKNACKKGECGLTDIYNEMKQGGHTMLAKYHQQLDEAVAKAYGFPKAKLNSSQSVVSFLFELNRIRAEGAEHVAGTGTDGVR